VQQTSAGVRLTFADGAEAQADVAVGADGIHSVLRDAVTAVAEPVYSGSVAYRGLMPAEALPDWPRNVSQLWMGEGKHFLVFPVRAGRLINYVGFVPQAREALESWSAPGDPAALAEAFAGWDPRVENLLAQVRETFWWGLYDREPLDRWSRGRLTLLGDAAHPMLPHLGQGVNQALEDAAVLTTVLAPAGPGDAPAALAEYERRRRDRTRTVQAGARANGRRYDSAYADLRQRDAEIVDMAAFRRWIFDHDAWAATDPAP
jgi:salicylate hydroxylase